MGTAKQEILLDSFNALKDNIYKNSNELADIILRVLVYDRVLALEMWTYLLKEFKRIGEYGNETYTLTKGMISDMSDLLGRGTVSKIVYENDFVANIIYNRAACPDDIVVAYYLDIKDFLRVNNLLEKVYSNSNHDTTGYDEDSFGYYLYRTIDYHCKNITPESVKFILEWCERASSENKAKIKLKLLDYM